MHSLLTKVLSGNPEAVEQFYKEYSPRILTFLNQKMPPEDAKEVLNDVFLDALDSLPLFQGKSAIATWLYKIAHNKTVDYYRKKKIKTLLLSQLPFLELVASEIHEPEFEYEKNKIRDRIETTLHHLSKKYRTILKLHYQDNIPIKEIALQLNLSFKATESLLFRARKSFQKAYERA